MKNIMIVDNSQDYFFDVHSVSESDFARIFPNHDQNVEFNDDLYRRPDIGEIEDVFHRMWHSRIKNQDAKGIHGILFFEDWERKKFYPKKKDIEEPDGGIREAIEPNRTIVIINSRLDQPINTAWVDENLFRTIFPLENQDVEFSEDLEKRNGQNSLASIMKSLNNQTIQKSSISGIDGIFHVGETEKKMYYVTKIDSDIPRHYPLSKQYRYQHNI